MQHGMLTEHTNKETRNFLSTIAAHFMFFFFAFCLLCFILFEQIIIFFSKYLRVAKCFSRC